MSATTHAIFRIYVQCVVGPWLPGQQKERGKALVTESWINFVDLAGSERVSSQEKVEEFNTKAKHKLKEGQHINKSLFFLTQVIKLKSEGKNTHIPYRNSPLTKILRFTGAENMLWLSYIYIL